MVLVPVVGSQKEEADRLGAGADGRAPRLAPTPGHVARHGLGNDLDGTGVYGEPGGEPVTHHRRLHDDARRVPNGPAELPQKVAPLQRRPVTPARQFLGGVHEQRIVQEDDVGARQPCRPEIAQGQTHSGTASLDDPAQPAVQVIQPAEIVQCAASHRSGHHRGAVALHRLHQLRRARHQRDELGLGKCGVELGNQVRDQNRSAAAGDVRGVQDDARLAPHLSPRGHGTPRP